MATCYVRNNGQILEASHNTVCANGTGTGTGIQQCCATGDICGAQGFCHFTHQLDAIVSGYYLGGCTDPKFSDAACPQRCTTRGTQDVIYNSTNGLWACCMQDGVINCSNPSDETFAAPNVAELFATSVSSSSTSTTSTISTSTPSTSAASATSVVATPSPSSAASTTGTATSTIAVAAAVPVVVVALIFAFVFWWWRKRKNRAQTNTPQWATGGAGGDRLSKQSYEPVSTMEGDKAMMSQSREMQNGNEVYEMTGEEYRAELDGRSQGPDMGRGPAGRRFRP